MLQISEREYKRSTEFPHNAVSCSIQKQEYFSKGSLIVPLSQHPQDGEEQVLCHGRKNLLLCTLVLRMSHVLSFCFYQLPF